jgi:hypothetical protein
LPDARGAQLLGFEILDVFEPVNDPTELEERRPLAQQRQRSSVRGLIFQRRASSV